MILLKKSSNISSLNIYYAILHNNKQGEPQCFELVKDGTKIRVNNENIKDYINKRIEFLSNKYAVFTNEIKKAFFEIIPKECITQFTSQEIELMLNGRPFLNILDLKKNTEYGGGYSPRNKTIILFWKVLMSKNQNTLSKIIKTLFNLKSYNEGIIDILSKRRFIVRSSKYPIRTKRNSKLQLFPFIEIKNKDFGFKECILEIPKTRDEREMNQIVSYLYNN